MPRIDCVNLPAAQRNIHRLACTAQVFAALAYRHFPHAGQRVDVAAMVVVGAVSLRRVNVVVGVGVVERPRPDVMRQQRIPGGKSFFRFQLHRMEIVAGVRTVVAEVLRPAEFVEKGFALIGGQRRVTDQRRLVEIVITAEARENVRAFRADVAASAAMPPGS